MADTIYWSDPYDGAVRGAPLVGGGNVDTIFSGAQWSGDSPFGLAIDAAADQIYWTNRFNNKIQRAPLAPGGAAETLYDKPSEPGKPAELNGPTGLAIHPAAGRIYWANIGDDTIRRAPLVPHGAVETLYGGIATLSGASGSTEGVVSPMGVTIDPVAGRIYWASRADNTIRGAPLAPHGYVETLYGPLGQTYPEWVAIDADAGRIYWTNFQSYGNGNILGAPIWSPGRGLKRPPTIDTLYDSTRKVTTSGGLAIDPHLAEPGPVQLEVARDTESFITGGWIGGALDWARDHFPHPTASPGLIYWGNQKTTATRTGWTNPNDQKIWRAPLSGKGTPELLYSDSTRGVYFPHGLALLRAPLGTAPPMISWQFVFTEGHVGGPLFGPGPAPDLDLGHFEQVLGCSKGTWAPDLLGSFLYRAPQSFTYQWILNGSPITGDPNSTKPDYTPTVAGSYSCRVKATNRAGSATQTSAAFTVTSSMLPNP